MGTAVDLRAPQTEGDKWRAWLNARLTVLVAAAVAALWAFTDSFDAKVDEPRLSYSRFDEPIAAIGSDVVVEYHEPGVRDGTLLAVELVFRQPQHHVAKRFGASFSAVVDGKRTWRVNRSEFEPLYDGRIWVVSAHYTLEDAEGFRITKAFRSSLGWVQ